MSDESAARHKPVNLALVGPPPATTPRAHANGDARHHRGIRGYLFRVQLVAVVPIGVLAAVLLYLHWLTQEHEREQLQIESARLLAAAVDNALDSTIERLSILARLWGSAAVDEPGIYAQARAALSANADWMDIVGIRDGGAVAFQAINPYGETHAPVDRFDTWRPVFEHAKPVVANVHLSPARGLVVSVGVPVVRDGRVTHALLADLNPHWYDALVGESRAPDGAVSAVFDANYKFVARSVDGDARRGGDPTIGLIEDLKRRRETFGRYVNLDGTTVYTAATHTKRGWSVGFATPAGPLDNALLMHLVVFGLVWVTAMLLGLGYAVAKARPIASALEALETQSTEIAQGRRTSHLLVSGVTEIDTAVAAIERSGELLQGAMQDRERALETEREARAEAEAANRTKDEFLALLGHELRNPLAAIANAVTVIRNPQRTEQQFSFGVDVIARQSRHLRRLIDDLLDVGRAMTDKIVIERQPMNFATGVRQVIDALQTAGRLSERTVEVDLDDVQIDADGTRLEQILTNLLGNAARYTEPGGRIRMRLRAENNEAVLEITDDGIGIEADDLPRVFEPFFQADSTKHLLTGGLGVGLTLTDKLVRLHGGSVHAASAGAGYGAAFTVRLPLSAAKPSRASPLAAFAGTARGLTVLLVEDNADARRTLRMALEIGGCKVLEAGDAVAAMETAQRERPKAALLDIGLPGVDGYELARRLRAKLGAEIVLIALTGYGTPKDEQRARSAGFDRHITKPVGIADLVGILVESTRDHATRKPRGEALG